MKSRIEFVMLAAMTILAAGAQERMNVVLKAGNVQNFNIQDVEQVVFDEKGSVSLQTGNAEGITATSATISARLVAEDSNLGESTFGFCYETSSDFQQMIQASETN